MGHMNALSTRDRTVRLNLRSEVIAVEASVSVLLSCVLLLGTDLAYAFGWAAVAGLVGVAAIQTLRLLPQRQDSPSVNLLGVDIDNSGGGGRREDDEGESGSATAFGWVLVVLAMPFIVAVVVIRFAVLYLVPTIVVTVAALVAVETGGGLLGWQVAVAVVVAWGGSVALSAANERLVIHPVAERKGISLE